MSTDKSQDEILNSHNIINQKISFFSQQNNSIEVLESDNDQQRALIIDNYNNNAGSIREDHGDIQNLNQSNQSQLDYYEEFRKIYVISYHLYIQKNKQVDIRTDLQKRIKIVEDKLRDLQKQQAPKKDTSEQMRAKRSRRTAEQIERRFKCEVEFCQRCYGSEGSLQQHIKLKHPDLYKKQEYKEYTPMYD